MPASSRAARIRAFTSSCDGVQLERREEHAGDTRRSMYCRQRCQASASFRSSDPAGPAPDERMRARQRRAGHPLADRLEDLRLARDPG